MSDFPKNVQIQIDEQRYWEGLGRQEMDFHQVLGELIDNSISASGKDSDGDLYPFIIEVALQRLGGKIKIKVADQGIGMSIDELTKSIFSLGGRGKSQGPLNEHGFGIKNSLCVLSLGNKLAWHIQTRDEDAVKDDQIYIVRGSFSSALKVELESDPQTWNEDITHATSKRGTRVFAETTFSFFNTTHPRSRTFETLVERLLEHLSIVYRGYLKPQNNKLWLRWRDIGDDETRPNSGATWKEHRLKPIEIPYDISGSNESTIKVDGPEGVAEAKYIRGTLDVEKVKDRSLGSPYPLSVYYQGSIRTQGIDIKVRNRVLKFGQLNEIWPEIPRHNDFNKFVGELIIDDPKFRTVNNKISLDPHNPYWIGLLDKLGNDDYKPQRTTRSKIETDIKKSLKITLEGMHSKSKVQLDRPIWGGTGVEVDIFHELSSGDIHIYEVKVGTAAPLDAYQLQMYWDGIVKDENKSPKLGRLVAKEIPDPVKNIIRDINKRKDTLANEYKLEYKTIDELGIR